LHLIFGGILIFGPIVRGTGNGSAGKISTNLVFAFSFVFDFLYRRYHQGPAGLAMSVMYLIYIQYLLCKHCRSSVHQGEQVSREMQKQIDF
jgi:hypothetical protein